MVALAVLFSKDGSRLLTYPRNAPRTSYTVPEGVREIGGFAFMATYNLKEITIPKEVVSIDECAFNASKGLTCPSTGYFYNKSFNVPLDWLPDFLEYIGKEAFYNTGCGIILLPSNVKYIGMDAFTNWHNGQTEEHDGEGILYSQSPIPPECEPNRYNRGSFGWIAYNGDPEEYLWEDPRHKCLYVPMGSKSAYENAFGWGYEYFEEIVEVEDVMAAAKEAIATGIRKIKRDDNVPAWEVARYNLQGQYLSRPAKGLNIIRYSDGSVRKEYIR